MAQNAIWVPLGLIEDNSFVVLVLLALVVLSIGILVPKLRGAQRQRRQAQAAQSGQKISCPRCSELTTTDEDACPNCGKDLTSL